MSAPSFAHVPSHHGYVAIDLGTLGGATSSARFINDAGQIVGESLTASGDTHVFIWEDGNMTDLGTLGRQAAIVPGSLPARGLGSGGQVVGLVGPEAAPGVINANDANAFLWDNGAMTDLGPVGFPSNLWVNGSGAVVRRNEIWTNGAWSPIPMDRGIAINDAGVVAGMTGDRLSVWDGATVTDGGNLAPGFLIVYGINEAGQVIGRSSTSDPAPGSSGDSEQRGFFWDGTTMHDIGSLGGHDLRASQPYDLNERGEVVGSSVNGAGQGRAFHWEAGVMRELGAVAGDRSSAQSINDAGQVAGYEFTTGDADSYRALLWEDGSVYDLGTLGGATATALEINESGWVVGWSENAAGEERATLWRPGTSVELTEALLLSVQGLEFGDSGVTALSTPLSFTLSEAIRSLSAGRDRVAIRQLEAFVRQVQSLVRGGLLSESDAEVLLGSVDAILDSLGGS